MLERAHATVPAALNVGNSCLTCVCVCVFIVINLSSLSSLISVRCHVCACVLSQTHLRRARAAGPATARPRGRGAAGPGRVTLAPRGAHRSHTSETHSAEQQSTHATRALLCPRRHTSAHSALPTTPCLLRCVETLDTAMGVRAQRCMRLPQVYSDGPAAGAVIALARGAHPLVVSA